MKQAAIASADAVLGSADLPAYGELANLLRAADNKLSALATYHSGPSKQAIEGLRAKLGAALDKIPN
jgi:hypothetical protein